MKRGSLVRLSCPFTLPRGWKAEFSYEPFSGAKTRIFLGAYSEKAQRWWCLRLPRFARDDQGWWCAPLIRVEVSDDYWGADGHMVEIPLVDYMEGDLRFYWRHGW